MVKKVARPAEGRHLLCPEGVYWESFCPVIMTSSVTDIVSAATPQLSRNLKTRTRGATTIAPCNWQRDFELFSHIVEISLNLYDSRAGGFLRHLHQMPVMSEERNLGLLRQVIQDR